MDNTTHAIKPKYALIFFIIIYLTATYIYCKNNTVPTLWDDSLYLTHSVIVYKALNGIDTLSTLYYGVRNDSGTYLFRLFPILLYRIRAPLILFLPVPAYFVFGTGAPGVVATFLALILMFMLIFYRLASKLTNSFTAVIAVIVTSTMPLTIGLSRYFLTEFGLMILTIMWVYVQLQSENFSKRIYIIPLGVILGLGMLMKVTFPVYISGPILWGLATLAWGGHAGKKLLSILANSFCVLGIGLLIASAWYLPNLYWITRTIFDVSYGKYTNIYSMGEVFEIQTLLRYWQHVINGGISSYYFFAFLLLFGFKVIKFIKLRKWNISDTAINESETPKGSLSMLLTWFFIPFIIFSFAGTKDIRFLLPAFPAFGIIMAKTITEVLGNEPFRAAKVGLLLVFPFIFLAYMSIPSNIRVTLNVGPFTVIAPYLWYTHQPLKQDWKQNQIIDTIKNDSLDHGVEIDSPIGVIPNHMYFNELNFAYSAVSQDVIYRFQASSSLLGSKDDFDDEIEKVLTMEYVIIKTGDEGQFAFNSEITDLLLDGSLPFTEIGRFDLPDGSEGILYRKK